MTVRIIEVGKDHPDVTRFGTHADLVDTQRIWAAYWNDDLAVLAGLVPASLLSYNAYVWSITTPVVRRCRKSLLLHSRRWLAEVLQEYPVLTGFCERKTVWLDHLGAKYVDDNGLYSKFIIRG